LPKLQAFAVKNDNAYPPTLEHSVEEEGITLPRLLRLFDFLAYNQHGAYYISRPEKYCFLVYNPGAVDYGYYSLTSERGWKFHPYAGKSLEEIYLEYCDEPQTFKQRIKKHLGLQEDPNDPDHILEPSELFKQQWKTPDVKGFPEFLPNEEQREHFLKDQFPYLFEGKEGQEKKILEEMQKRGALSELPEK
ncbi:MAG: hypothetical protein KDD76_03630, partial [Rickettsiales bacterium]|nr:hypothetical protein [Rickettsiales bacterium]